MKALLSLLSFLLCVQSVYTQTQEKSPQVLNLFFAEFKFYGETGDKIIGEEISRELRNKLEFQLFQKTKELDCKLNVIRREKLMDAALINYNYQKRESGDSINIVRAPNEAHVIVLGYIKEEGKGLSMPKVELSITTTKGNNLEEYIILEEYYGSDLRKLADVLVRKSQNKFVSDIFNNAFSDANLNGLLTKYGLPTCIEQSYTIENNIAWASLGLAVTGATTYAISRNIYNNTYKNTELDKDYNRANSLNKISFVTFYAGIAGGTYALASRLIRKKRMKITSGSKNLPNNLYTRRRKIEISPGFGYLAPSQNQYQLGVNIQF